MRRLDGALYRHDPTGNRRQVQSCQRGRLLLRDCNGLDSFNARCRSINYRIQSDRDSKYQLARLRSDAQYFGALLFGFFLLLLWRAPLPRIKENHRVRQRRGRYRGK